MKFRPLVVAVALVLGACTEHVTLAYAPTLASTARSWPVVGTVGAVDQRGEADPTWIGAVRNMYGMPMKILHVPRPLADMVADSMRDALARRGLLTANGAGPIDCVVIIKAFDSSQLFRREANIDLVFVFRDHATGGLLAEYEATGNPVEPGELFSRSPDKLALVAQRAMSTAIDTTLAQPAVVAALHSAVP